MYTIQLHIFSKNYFEGSISEPCFACTKNRRSSSAVKMTSTPYWREDSLDIVIERCQLPDTRRLPCPLKNLLQHIHRRQVCTADFCSGIEGIYNVSDRICCACSSHLHLGQQTFNLCFSGDRQMGLDGVLPFNNAPINSVDSGGTFLDFAFLVNLFLYLFTIKFLFCDWATVEQENRKQVLIWYNIKFKVRKQWNFWCVLIHCIDKLLAYTARKGHTVGLKEWRLEGLYGEPRLIDLISADFCLIRPGSCMTSAE